ncbi:hypothetical protein H8356DRAFT_1638989 [Neocallimastix lanati (nom. inval.)]|nr:hypothetical protein H8356DRAFT_1638989 [Neocallimastix sp. JGI-2020a]
MVGIEVEALEVFFFPFIISLILSFMLYVLSIPFTILFLSLLLASIFMFVLLLDSLYL